MVDDLVADCPQSEDEPILLSQIVEKKSLKCKCQHQIPCRPGHIKCYNISEICSYRLKKNNHLIHCRTGEHLQSCMNFICDVMFKCAFSYCISWAYMCDQKWDCPYGDDENECAENCRNRAVFRCKYSRSICLHLGNVCDSKRDCPLGDDELLCAFQDFHCPPSCICLAFAIKCMIDSFTKLENNLPHVYVHIASVSSLELKILSETFQQAYYISVINSNITNICDEIDNDKLMSCDISQNQVHLISKCCFPSQNLQIVFLKQNQIKFFLSEAFNNLNKLEILNLVGNPIIRLPDKLFWHSSHVKLVNFGLICFQIIEHKPFPNLRIDFIVTADHKVCCIKPEKSVCTADVPWYFACGHMLQNNAVKILFLITAVVLSVFIVLSLVLHKLTQKSGAAFSITVMFISLNDASQVLYFVIMLANDRIFGEIFPVHEEQWRAGLMCYAASTFNLHFLLEEQLLPVFLSWSRFMVVLHPITTNFKRSMFVFKCLVVYTLVSTQGTVIPFKPITEY